MSTHPAVANGSYDVARVREDFPALGLKVYGKPLEELVRECLGQYLWGYNRYKRPAGAPPPPA